MNGLHLHTGNRLETLVEQLTSVIASPSPAASPLQPETILVQSLGMRRWISLQIAEKLGICMNIDFPFPRNSIDTIIRSLLPDAAPPDSFAPDLLTWKIHHLLPGFLHLPAFAPVARFLSDADSLKHFQLSQRLASLFDQYLAYRPAMLCQWEASSHPHLETGDAAWQAPLWRALNQEQLLHFGAILQRLPAAIAAQHEAPRLSIFGITTLPPAQMEVFLHLAANRPVHLFLLSPSKEYHGDDLTPKQRARMKLPEAPADEAGNPLLTSLGRLHAHFTEVILELDDQVGARTIGPSTEFTPPGVESLLHRLQSDILSAQPPEAVPLSPGDTSIQFHGCHSPMREIELLYDTLLNFLDTPQTDERSPLLPRDILVMAPDIEKYAPYIHAVFGNPEAPSLRIPYSIADRQARSESQSVDTFLRLLDLPDSRFTAPEIYSLLHSPPFRACFAFTDADMEQIHDWLLQSGIRWGIDASHREQMALPPFGENSWRSGIDRLLLGYAMAGHGTTTFGGILPLDDVEGSNTELLGRFITACEHLFQTITELQQPHTLAQWPATLQRLVDRFFPSDNLTEADELDAIRHLRETIMRLQHLADASSPEQPAPLPALREHLASALAETTARGRFLTGGVTFCALKPMRSIPARVIWLLGMDDGVFPRRGEPLQFDLIAKQPKLGDRSPRQDDRALFLEAIISAREKLCISFIARSIRNNEVIPPSIVVSELLDYLDHAIAPTATARQHLFRQHPLHPFSPTYFQPDSPLRSYSAANAIVAQATRQSAHILPEAPVPPFSTALPPCSEESTFTLKQLVDFLRAPCGLFLKERFGVLLRMNEEALAEHEPIFPDHLQSYSIRKQLTDALLNDTPSPSADILAATCQLPPGSIGQQHYHRFHHAASAFSGAVRAHQEAAGALRPPISITLSFPPEPTQLTALLRTIYGETCLLHRPSGFKPKDRLHAWAHHLAWNAHLEASGHPHAPTLFIAEDAAYRYTLPADSSASNLLAELLTLAREGLCRPLPLFPKSSHAYARSLLKDGDASKALADAATAWHTTKYNFDGDDSLDGVSTCFPPECGLPFGEEFAALALQVFTPLLSAEEKL